MRPARAEEFLQQFHALSRQDAAAHFHSMIKLWMIKHPHDRAHSAGFWIIRTVNQASDASVYQRARTHGARLDGHEKFAIKQPIIANRLSRITKRDHFSVSRRVGVDDVSIETPAYDPPIMHDDRSHRHFTGFKCALRGAQGFVHPQLVAFECALD
jgi:hypothetical protein